MDVEALLRHMSKRQASDLFITAGAPPSIKVNGRLESLSSQPLTPEQARSMVYVAMPPRAKEEFETDQDTNFALDLPDVGRFRVSVFQQQNAVGMVVRRIETRIPTVDELGLPQVLKVLSMARRGLIIFVGATGAGKSTSLAAMVDFRNRNSSGHIVTIEDPIEFVHKHASCIVTQREVGIDTKSFEAGLKNAMRQAPDVILVGEIRTRDTMEKAIAFAETGHLCLATLHSNNANQALERILNFFPEDRHSQLLMDLSMNLKSVVAQRLIPTSDGKGRCAAVEILINSPRVADLLRQGEMHQLKDAMQKSETQGMKTFDRALYELYCNGRISADNAIAHADSENEVRLMIKLGKTADPSKLTDAVDGIQLEE
jgi:twitching motility protein PilU